MRAEKTTLADHLQRIASEEDDGAPKTGRRYYYLALSYGYISPDMGSSDAAKRERAALWPAREGPGSSFSSNPTAPSRLLLPYPLSL